MAQATHRTYETARKETVDLSSSEPSEAGASHWGSYAGLAIVAMILIAMLLLQSTSASTF